VNLLVKVCGLTTREGIDAAATAGADAVGFVFHAPSPRDVTPAHAAALAAPLPASVLRVAVTLQPSQALVDRVLAEFWPDVWQSDAADFDSICLPESVARWPVLRSGMPAPGTPPARLLFESAASGVGLRADWHAAAELARISELILGGGLDAANVGRAIATVRPYGVDVSSGVEHGPGIKDPSLIRDFIAAARAGGRRKSA
jgi:phosphoribosylanthranilate isomerase